MKVGVVFPWAERVPRDVLVDGSIQDVGRYKYLVAKAKVVASKRTPDPLLVSQIQGEFDGLIEGIRNRAKSTDQASK